MKKLILLLSVIFLLSNCKDKTSNDPCVGPECPLSDGTSCPGNMVNIDNQCVCAEGTTELNTEDGVCWEGPGTLTNAFFYFEFDCECATGDLLFSVTDDDPIYGAYSLDKGFGPNGNRIGGPINMLPGSVRADFDGQLYPASCEGKYFYINGSMSTDTLTYSLYFLNTSSMDTCGPFVAYRLN